MSMDWQRVPVSLFAGMDNRTDERALVGKMLRAKNAIYSEPGIVRKRGGYDSPGCGPGEAGSLRQVASYRKELLGASGGQLYGHDADNTDLVWSNSRGYFEKLRVSERHEGVSPGRVATEAGVTCCDVVSVGGYTIIASATVNRVRVLVTDTATGAVYARSQLTGRTTTNVRCVSMSGHAWVLYNSVSGSNFIDVAKVDLTSTTTAKSGAVLQGLQQIDATAAVNNFDAVVVGTTCHVVINGNQRAAFSNGAGGGPAVGWGAGPASAANTTLGVYASGGIVYVVYYNGASVYTGAFNASSFAVIFSNVVVETIASVVCCEIGASGTGSAFDAFYDIRNGTIPTDSYVKRSTISTAGAISGTKDFCYGVVLSTRPFARTGLGETTRYVGVVYPSDFADGAAEPLANPTGFILRDLDGSGYYVAARFCDGRAQFRLSSGSPRALLCTQIDDIPFTDQVTPAGYRFAIPRATGNSLYGNRSYHEVSIVTVDDNYFPGEAATVGDTLHLLGGYVHSYDGQRLVEHGFHHGPDRIRVQSTSGAGGQLSNGTYLVRAIYVWHDANGRRYESAPSRALTMTLSGGGATQSAVIRLNSLVLSGKCGQVVVSEVGGDVEIYVYRTIAGGTTYYYEGVVQNSGLTATTDYTIGTVTDAALAANAQPYFTSELAHGAPPPPRAIGVAAGRLWLSGSDGRAYFTKREQAAVGTQFAPASLYVTPRSMRRINAIGELDDKIVFFGDQEISALVGDGPNITGAGRFSEDRTIAVESGARSGAGLVRTDAGLIFDSTAGIQILTRGLSVEPVGDDVSDFSDAHVVAAHALPAQESVVFVQCAPTGSGRLLYLHTGRGPDGAPTYFWSEHSQTFAGFPIGGCVVDDDHCFGTSQCWVARQSSAIGAVDDQGSYQLQLRTSWIRPSGLQGFQRARRIFVLGRKLADVNRSFTLKAYYDNDESLVETFTVNVQDAFPAGDDLMEFRVRPKRQKFTSISLELADHATETSEHVAFLEIAIEAGLRRGGPRLPATKTIAGA